jgi:tryptophanyl-tRNA synthetase
MATSLLALGLDPEKCTLFVQSHRPEHTELAWLLATVTPVSWLERTPTYKEKRESQPDDVNHGLLTYPVLQAADIVIYKATYVPVGRDQAAHLELSREIVRAFNNLQVGECVVTEWLAVDLRFDHHVPPIALISSERAASLRAHVRFEVPFAELSDRERCG